MERVLELEFDLEIPCVSFEYLSSRPEANLSEDVAS